MALNSIHRGDQLPHIDNTNPSLLLLFFSSALGQRPIWESLRSELASSSLFILKGGCSPHIGFPVILLIVSESGKQTSDLCMPLPGSGKRILTVLLLEPYELQASRREITVTRIKTFCGLGGHSQKHLIIILQQTRAVTSCGMSGFSAFIEAQKMQASNHSEFW